MEVSVGPRGIGIRLGRPFQVSRIRVKSRAYGCLNSYREEVTSEMVNRKGSEDRGITYCFRLRVPLPNT